MTAAARTTVGERGSATVWLLAMMGVVVATALAVGLFATTEVVRRRAAVAADAAALVGAAAVDMGPGGACPAAAALARANAARLSACAVAGTVVSVTVHADLPAPLSFAGPATARAAAGPATADRTDSTGMPDPPA